MSIKYEWTFGNYAISMDAYEGLIDQCSQLYSSQYGKWSKESPIRPGENISLSPEKICQWLENENSAIYWAKDNEKLIGYAIAIQIDVPKYGIISWVTQLVVHEEYRNREIAKKILHSIWGFTDHYAWGIISANPYAFRALEKTTRRRSDPQRIKHNIKKILSIGIEHVPYITEETKVFITNEISKINTEFYVDHSDVENMISNVTTEYTPWKLGQIDEGWEWIAFTFQDQLPFELSQQEIDTMLNTSDQLVKNAYTRMDFSVNHKWMKNTENEVDFIINELELKNDDVIADFGCGQGRHTICLAQKGMEAIGVDYIDNNIDFAKKECEKKNIPNCSFILGDCRSVSLPKKAKAAICLYDVVGSYSDNRENMRILKNIYSNLENNGVALISVKNNELTMSMAKNIFTLEKSTKELMSLKPSNIMETTGNVFDPEYYLVDEKTGIVYRREQFKRGRALPIELIVRDKRFYMEEIKQMCEEAGFEVLFTRFVSAKDWTTGFEATHKSAKEILVKCKKKQ